MTYRWDSEVRVTCNTCGYVGSPWALELHSCDVGTGRHEDWPACGCDADGCQTLPQHTADYWTQVMTSGQSRYLFEPGSPEWYDACDMDADYAGGWDDDTEFDSQAECEAAGMHGDTGDGTDRPGVFTCRYCGGEYVSSMDDDEPEALTCCDGTGWTGNPRVRCADHYVALDPIWHGNR